MKRIPFVQISSIVDSPHAQPIYSLIDKWSDIFKITQPSKPVVGLLINKVDIHSEKTGLAHLVVDFQIEIISVEELDGIYSLVMDVLMTDDNYVIYKLGK